MRRDVKSAFSPVPDCVDAGIRAALDLGRARSRRNRRALAGLGVAAALAIMFFGARGLLGGAENRPDVTAPGAESTGVYTTRGGFYYHARMRCIEEGNFVQMTVPAAAEFGKLPCPVCVGGGGGAVRPFEGLRAGEIVSVNIAGPGPGLSPVEIEDRARIGALAEMLGGISARPAEHLRAGKYRLNLAIYTRDGAWFLSFGDTGPSAPGYAVEAGSVALEIGEEDCRLLFEQAENWRAEINPYGAWADVREDTVTPDGATFDLRCESAFAYGTGFVIERREGGSWVELPVVYEGAYAFSAIALVLRPEQPEQLDLDWEYLYGSLEPGEYRIVKDRELGFYGEFVIE